MTAPQLVVTAQPHLVADAPRKKAFEARLAANIGQPIFIENRNKYHFTLTHLLNADGKLHESSQRFVGYLLQVFGADATVEIQQPVEVVAGLRELPEAKE